MRTLVAILTLAGVAASLAVAAVPAAANPAARTGDATTRGTIIGPGAPTVLICGKPAVRLSDLVQSNAGPLNTPLTAPIVTGSATVLIAGKPAARVGDPVANGDRITTGCPTVIIGG